VKCLNVLHEFSIKNSSTPAVLDVVSSVKNTYSAVVYLRLLAGEWQVSGW